MASQKDDEKEKKLVVAAAAVASAKELQPVDAVWTFQIHPRNVHVIHMVCTGKEQRCINFDKGFCKYGIDCNYAHVVTFATRGLASNNINAPVCRSFCRGYCPNGSTCPGIHMTALMTNVRGARAGRTSRGHLRNNNTSPNLPKVICQHCLGGGQLAFPDMNNYMHIIKCFACLGFGIVLVE